MATTVRIADIWGSGVRSHSINAKVADRILNHQDVNENFHLIYYFKILTIFLFVRYLPPNLINLLVKTQKTSDNDAVFLTIICPDNLGMYFFTEF